MDDHIRLCTLDWNAYLKCARQAAAEGIVLLRNEKSVLPLAEGTRVSLFGRGQLTYYRSGTGSGGMVNVAKVTGIREALENEPGILLNETLEHLYDRWNDENPPRVGHGWGEDPWSQDEMPLTQEIVRDASAFSDTAICIIARTAGEDRDNADEPGSYRLTSTEMDMLEKVRASFPRMIVLLNVGGIMDMSFVARTDPDAVAYVWQGGMVGGLGVVDVLTGRVSPSGHLTDTIAKSLQDYPSAENFGRGTADVYQEDIYVGYRYFESVAKDRVLYPFGYGMTYTTFEISTRKVETEDREVGRGLTIDLEAEVTNTGNFPGREVVQVYAGCPQGELGKAARVLVDFQKTRLLEPSQSQTLSFRIPVRRFASYDDSGATGNPSCWVLEQGRYDLYVGENVRDAVCVTPRNGAFTLSGSWAIEQAEEACAPVTAFRRMVMHSGLDESPDIASYIEGPDEEDIAAAAAQDLASESGAEERNETASAGSGETLTEAALRVEYEEVPLRSIDNGKRMYENLPFEIPYQVAEWTLEDVMEKRCTMEEFIGQLTDTELSRLIRGEGMGSPLVTPGTASAFGGVSEDLRKRGIPVLCCDDGPSGMRLDCGDHAFSLPSGTLLASTFDTQLNQELFSFLGLEMVKNRVDCLLGPGINIHRNPLNGRNFEYFSEDPYLTGRIACAQLAGLKEQGVSGVLKHFAANNRESGRHSLDSIVSERALREIYLRGFEIAVREGGADAIMTSYGLLNGVHTASLYDLTTTILREEWGFDGIVMTDWWASFTPKDIIDHRLEGAEPDGEDVPREVDENRLLDDLMSGRVYDFSPMVRAQGDLFMVVPDGGKDGVWLDESEDVGGQTVDREMAKVRGITQDPRFRGTTLDALEEKRLTRAELQRSAANICRFAMKSQAMARLCGRETTVEVVNAPEGEKLDAVAQVTFTEVPGEGLVYDLSHLACGRGDDSLLGFSMESGAYYTFAFEGECTAGKLAQVPVSFFFTSIPLAVMVWNGTDGQKAVKRVRFKVTTRSNVFRLHFGQNGVKLDCVRITKDGPGDDRQIGLLPD